MYLDEESGLVAATEEITPSMVIELYKKGIFPWPVSEEEWIYWFSPPERGVLFFDEYRPSTSFKKLKRKSKLRITFCQAFEEVIQSCADVPRKDQDGTWITTEIIEAYVELFQMEKAYSVEAWNGDVLVGGVYGVLSDKYVSGESMFFLESGASKLCLDSLILNLQNFGVSWIDTQMTTSLLKSLGGRTILRNDFMEFLNEGKILEGSLFQGLKNGWKET